jgi:formylglycine-generating enzyme required for sulfatase activity
MTFIARLPAPLVGLAILVSTAFAPAAAWAQAGVAEAVAAQPGFVAGADKPAGDGPFVQVPGGWMTPYEETIPGTEVSFRMIPIPGGTFRMGSPNDEEGRTTDEGPAFEVAVPPFWMGQHEVTWAEYKRYMAACDLFIAMHSAQIRPIDETNVADAVTAPSNLYDPTTTFTNGEDPSLPAVTMTQFAARQYTKWLSGLTGRFYRLPAESEWEYACRAGGDTPFSCGDSDALEEVAWFADNGDDTTHPVGQKKPNAFGLHDMHGNVAEWVVDELVAGGYATPAALPQPVAAAAAIQWPERLYPRVLRGGAFYDEANECRSAARRGSRDAGGNAQDPDWKDVDPNFPKSPWWYTEEPALGVGMRIVRPFAEPADVAERRRWWEADIESIKNDVASRLEEGRGSRGIVDPALPADLKAEGITE